MECRSVGPHDRVAVDEPDVGGRALGHVAIRPEEQRLVEPRLGGETTMVRLPETAEVLDVRERPLERDALESARRRGMDAGSRTVTMSDGLPSGPDAKAYTRTDASRPSGPRQWRMSSNTCSPSTPEPNSARDPSSKRARWRSTARAFRSLTWMAVK